MPSNRSTGNMVCKFGLRFPVHRLWKDTKVFPQRTFKGIWLGSVDPSQVETHLN